MTKKKQNKTEEYYLEYNIENLYTNEDKTKFKNSLSFINNPPILYIKDNLDNEVTFLLTKEVTRNLRADLEEVYQAYLGYKYGKRNFENELKIKDWKKLPDLLKERIKEAPIKYVFLAVVVFFAFLLTLLTNLN